MFKIVIPRMTTAIGKELIAIFDVEFDDLIALYGLNLCQIKETGEYGLRTPARIETLDPVGEYEEAAYTFRWDTSSVIRGASADLYNEILDAAIEKYEALHPPKLASAS